MSGVENSRPGLKYEYATTGAMSDTVPGNGGDQGVTPAVGGGGLVAGKAGVACNHIPGHKTGLYPAYCRLLLK